MPRDSELLEELRVQNRGWQANAVLRELYRGWYREVALRLSAVDGATVELGSGIGKLREAVPEAVLTDVEPTPWVEAAVDAHRLPYADGSLANIVLVDVLHHLGAPARFFDEAARCLRAGGRIVLVEPYCSPVAYRLYRKFHHERTELDVDPFAAGGLSSADPLDSNQALPTLLFFRHAGEFSTRWPELTLKERKRFALFAYPLSGGWRRRSLLPRPLLRPLLGLERALAPLAPTLAFRCMVVLERS